MKKKKTKKTTNKTDPIIAIKYTNPEGKEYGLQMRLPEGLYEPDAVYTRAVQLAEAAFKQWYKDTQNDKQA